MSSPSDVASASRRTWRWIAVAATATAVTAAGITYASAATTAAVPNVRFTKVYYNSPGADTRTNASLNAEYVQVTNKSSKAVSVTGWTIKDVAGHTFKLSGSLAAGKTVTIHTGKGKNGTPAGHSYWQSGNYIWNNTGDTATLRNKTGATVHTCKWGATGSVTTCAPTPTPTKPTAAPTMPATTRPTTAAPTPTTTERNGTLTPTPTVEHPDPVDP
ncbi:lamin tail domain-containing protein [Actinoplanes regularis]|uniref:Lamin Tail Domain n=1 Tax=Actinoplanes regularis TaxID=52697 RepID=A0A238Y7W9_9ACTN|nr:lamin tail domain-containing protein [Actinoplanes regularis]GIE86131.1 hypothetical protein Are01nite_26110 [Actinoplanes regularis]SNR66871.1 Lamin Tail Domain [Actinoplanes regularis]